MLCWDHSEKKWIERKSVDLRRREVLGRNMFITIPQDMGVNVSKAIGIGRIAEAYGGRESIVGKITLYEIDLSDPICKLCPAHPIELVELRERWVKGPETSLIYDVGLAERMLRRVTGSLMVLGESISSIIFANVAERKDVAVYTINRKIPGVRTHTLSLESWDEHKVRHILVSGRLSEEEKIFVEEILHKAVKVTLIFHPIFRGQKIQLSIGGNISIRTLSKPLINPGTVYMARKIFRKISQNLAIVKPGENVPDNIYTVIDFTR
jgi:hypothetical protein